jgi:hypothetical protein
VSECSAYKDNALIPTNFRSLKGLLAISDEFEFLSLQIYKLKAQLNLMFLDIVSSDLYGRSGTVNNFGWSSTKIARVLLICSQGEYS